MSLPLWKGTRGVLLGVMSVAVLACTGCGFFVPETLSSISITPQSAPVTIGTPTQLSATGVNSDGTMANLSNLTWTSSNPQIATVSSTGVVTGVSAGTATITAASGAVTGTDTVTVSGSGSTSGTLAINPANQTFSSALGGVQFTAALNGQDVTNSTTWTSSNPAVAQFASTPGLATFTGQGTTTISATVNNGGTTSSGATTLIVGP